MTVTDTENIPVAGAEQIPCQEISSPEVLSKNPLVSVKMITYNHESYIAQAIEGVLQQQTDFPIELVIGEDCSTDRTREIVLEYQQKYPDIIRVLFSEMNIGVTKNSLRTTYRCRGKYIAFCEGDDYWTNTLKLHKQVELLIAHPECSMAVAETDVYINNNDNSTKYINTLGRTKSNYIFLNDYFNDNYMHTSTFLLLKRNLVEIYSKYSNHVQFNDTVICFFILESKPFIVLHEVVSVYRITRSGIWTSLSSHDKIKREVKLFNIILFLCNNNNKILCRLILFRLYKDLTYICIKNKNYIYAIQNLLHYLYYGIGYNNIPLLKDCIKLLTRLFK